MDLLESDDKLNCDELITSDWVVHELDVATGLVWHLVVLEARAMGLEHCVNLF